MAAWRLIESGHADGFENMAVDEAIALAVARGEQPPTLRLYGWRPPAVSLGYFQPLDESIDADACRERGYDVVRRPSGGRAILHDDELTYSVCIRQADIRGGHSVMESYRVISRGIIAGLGLLGAEVALGEAAGPRRETVRGTGLRAVCFARTSRCDLQAAGRKVVGSAQVRRHGGILQHGSIPLSLDLEAQVAVMPTSAQPQAPRALRDAAISIPELLGRPVGYDELSEAVARGFAATFEVQLASARLSAAERSEADRLRERRYATAEWTQRVPARR